MSHTRTEWSVASVVRRRVWLFDLDGTLVDSTPAHQAAFRAALSELAPALLPGFRYDRLAGTSTREAMRRLGVEGETARRLAHRKQQRYREYVAEGKVATFPGAYQLLDRLRERDCEAYLVTGGSRGSVERVLAGCGLLGRFRAVLTGDDLDASKPDPAVYREACRRWDVRTDETVVIEDSAQGVASAVAAGLATLHVHVWRAAGGALAVRTLGDILALLDGGDPR